MTLALAMGLSGCGTAGVEEGAPKGDLTPTVKMDPKMTDMSGRSFKDTGSAQTKAGAAAKDAGSAEPKK